jgi:hypothetical protein
MVNETEAEKKELRESPSLKKVRIPNSNSESGFHAWNATASQRLRCPSADVLVKHPLNALHPLLYPS